MNNFKMVYVKLTADDYKRLERIARGKGASVRETARQFVEQGIAKKN
jgi:hypothetical protein